MAKQLKKFLPLWLLILVCACSQPAHAIIDSKGNKINLNDWRNKWVVINYWASWCAPCAEEIPQLNQFYKRYQNQVILLGVNEENLSRTDLMNAMNILHIQYPVLQVDPASILKLPAITVLPTTFIINPEGKLVKELIGPQTVKSLENLMGIADE
jgi:thiol-disulfide isomerase/thioredoxin